MRVSRIILALFVSSVFVASCDDDGDGNAALDAKVAELETKISLLEDQLDAVRVIANGAEGTLTTYADALAAADMFFEVTQINGDGDVVFEGVNVHIQDGGGETCPTAMTGKGNLIVGYDEPELEGTCTGGSNDGNPCTGDFACTGGTCTFTVVSAKTGTHNLVVGSQHTYTSCGGLLAGSGNTISAEGGFCAGDGNTVAASSAAVVGGIRNSASGGAAVVVGGSDNTASGASAVVTGGIGNTADTDGTIVP
jgi:hypothetical protein